jgi:hypothetical protein
VAILDHQEQQALALLELLEEPPDRAAAVGRGGVPQVAGEARPPRRLLESRQGGAGQLDEAQVNLGSLEPLVVGVLQDLADERRQAGAEDVARGIAAAARTRGWLGVEDPGDRLAQRCPRRDIPRSCQSRAAPTNVTGR